MQACFDKGTLWIGARFISPGALMSVVAIESPTLHPCLAWNGTSLVAQSILQRGINGIVVVLAVVLIAVIAEVMFVAELAVADACLELL